MNIKITAFSLIFIILAVLSLSFFMDNISLKEGATTMTPTPASTTTKSASTTTTAAPTTKAPTTAAPTTKAPTTAAPTTKAPTTAAPTTAAPTTAAPTTAAPTTGYSIWGSSLNKASSTSPPICDEECRKAQNEEIKLKNNPSIDMPDSSLLDEIYEIPPCDEQCQYKQWDEIKSQKTGQPVENVKPSS